MYCSVCTPGSLCEYHAHEATREALALLHYYSKNEVER